MGGSSALPTLPAGGIAFPPATPPLFFSIENRTKSPFFPGHGCSNHRILLKRRKLCLGMDALVIVFFWNTVTQFSHVEHVSETSVQHEPVAKRIKLCGRAPSRALEAFHALSARRFSCRLKAVQLTLLLCYIS